MSNQYHEIFKRFLTQYRMALYAHRDLVDMQRDIDSIDIQMQNLKCPTRYMKDRNGKAVMALISGSASCMSSDNDGRLAALIVKKDELIKELDPKIRSAQIQIREINDIMSRMPKDVQYVIVQKYAINPEKTYDYLAKELHYSRSGLQKTVELAVVRAVINS